MTDSLNPTAPDFDRVQRETGVATRDALALTYLELQEERLQRQQSDRALAQPLADWVVLSGAFTGGDE